MQTPVIKLCCKTCSFSAYLDSKKSLYCYRKYENKKDTDYCGIWESKGMANNEAISEFEKHKERNA